MAKSLYMRKILLIGEINEEQYRSFTTQLTELELKNQSEEIIIELASEGGVDLWGLAICSRMRTSPCPFHVRAYGVVASAATMVLATADKRALAESSWVMVHESSNDLTGSTESLEKQAKHMRRLENQWLHMIASATGTSIVIWQDLHKNETWLTPQECLKLKLIDEVF